MNFVDFADDDDAVHSVVAKLIKSEFLSIGIFVMNGNPFKLVASPPPPPADIVEKFKGTQRHVPHHIMLYRDGQWFYSVQLIILTIGTT